MPELKEILAILKHDLLGSVVALRSVFGPDFVTKFRRAVTLLEELDALLESPPTLPSKPAPKGVAKTRQKPDDAA